MPDLLVNDLSHVRAAALGEAIRYAAWVESTRSGRIRLDKWNIVDVLSVSAELDTQGTAVRVNVKISGFATDRAALFMSGVGYTHDGALVLRTVKECLEFLLELTSNPASASA